MRQPQIFDYLFTPKEVAEIQTATEDHSILERWLNELELNDNFKSALTTVLETTVVAARAVVRLGAWIISCVKRILKEYPTTFKSAAIGFLLGFLIWTIPVFGWIFGPMVTPFLVTATVILGFVADVREKYRGSSGNFAPLARMARKHFGESAASRRTSKTRRRS